MTEETKRELARIRSRWEHSGYARWKDDAFRALEIAEELIDARRLSESEELADVVEEASAIRRAYLDFWGAHSFNDIQAVGREPHMPDTPALDAALATHASKTK